MLHSRKIPRPDTTEGQDNTDALQEIAAQPPAEVGAPADTVTLAIDRRELREQLQEASGKAARGMAKVVEMAIEEISEHGWETPEDEMDRLLMVQQWEQFSRAPRVYTPDVPGLAYSIYANAQKIIVTKKGLARRLGVGETTFYEWMKKQPLLAEAVRAGEALQEERLASRMASGIKYPQSIFAVLKNLHKWTDKVEETHKLDFREALQQQQAQAKRVQWDKAMPAPLAPPPTHVIDVVPDSPLPSSPEGQGQQVGGAGEAIGEPSM